MSLVLQHPYAQALAWALIHFVWQGAAIALALVIIQRLGRLSASARYTSGVVAMGVMLAVPLITFERLSATAVPKLVSLVPATAEPATGLSAPAALTPADLAPVLPASSSQLPTIVLAIWVVGVVVLSLRLFGGWLVARRLARRALSPAS